jgi:hypothetical protein
MAGGCNGAARPDLSLPPKALYGSAQPLEFAVPRVASQDGRDKFQRHRANRKARGMKLLRIWVPDPKAAGFADEAKRQAALLRGAPEELDALEFIQAAMDTDDWR